VTITEPNMYTCTHTPSCYLIRELPTKKTSQFPPSFISNLPPRFLPFSNLRVRLFRSNSLSRLRQGERRIEAARRQHARAIGCRDATLHKAWLLLCSQPNTKGWVSRQVYRQRLPKTRHPPSRHTAPWRRERHYLEG
jgi:hypothetical protein